MLHATFLVICIPIAGFWVFGLVHHLLFAPRPSHQEDALPRHPLRGADCKGALGGMRNVVFFTLHFGAPKTGFEVDSVLGAMS